MVNWQNTVAKLVVLLVLYSVRTLDQFAIETIKTVMYDDQSHLFPSVARDNAVSGCNTFCSRIQMQPSLDFGEYISGQ